MRKNLFISLSVIVFFVIMASSAMTTDKIGEVNALKGKAGIMRSNKKSAASVKDSVLMTDIVETEKSSRMKILFIDDSLLTLGEKSKVTIKEYVLGDEKKRGQSIFALLDGRVRAVVGKNKLEIHTPTAVAAARGTIFILWMKGNSVSPITCLAVIKGAVDLRNINKAVQTTESVTEGNMSCVDEGMTPLKQEPILPVLLKELIESTEADSKPAMDNPKGTLAPDTGDGNEVATPAVPPIELEPKGPSIELRPIETQQPIVTEPTPVVIDTEPPPIIIK